MHNPALSKVEGAAIHLFLSNGDASAMRGAMSLVLQACAEQSRSRGVEARMHPAEAFYYVAKMLSLVTGAYSQ